MEFMKENKQEWNKQEGTEKELMIETGQGKKQEETGKSYGCNF